MLADCDIRPRSDAIESSVWSRHPRYLSRHAEIPPLPQIATSNKLQSPVPYN